MHTYTHKVQYYETDQMGIVHHSNYIRWFEEARIDFMDSIGISYKSLEEVDFYSPVLSAQCQYKKVTKFGEDVDIVTTLKEFSNVRFKLEYQVLERDTKEVKAYGETTHCFINKAGKVISLKRQSPRVFELFQSNVE